MMLWDAMNIERAHRRPQTPTGDMTTWLYHICLPHIHMLDAGTIVTMGTDKPCLPYTHHTWPYWVATSINYLALDLAKGHQ